MSPRFPSKTRFRWFQESSVYRDAPPFALDGVYISEPCPNHCGGHGDCISGVCFCDMGYTGKPEAERGNKLIYFPAPHSLLYRLLQWSRIAASRPWPVPPSWPRVSRGSWVLCGRVWAGDRSEAAVASSARAKLCTSAARGGEKLARCLWTPPTPGQCTSHLYMSTVLGVWCETNIKSLLFFKI